MNFLTEISYYHHVSGGMETWGFSGSVISILFFLSHKQNQFSLICKKKPSKEKILIFPLLQTSKEVSWSIRKEVLSLRGTFF